MQQYIQKVQKIPIKFEKYINKGKNLIGIMVIPSELPAVQFELSVSGRREVVKEFKAEILELSIQPIEDLPEDWLRQPAPEEVANKHRDYWRAILHQLDEEVSRAALEDLQDPDFLCKKACVGKHSSDWRKLPRGAIHRRLRVRPLGLESDRRYAMRFTIDPWLEAGKMDIYEPPTQATRTVSITCTPSQGDPDLYLFRGGDTKDWSLNGEGETEQVYSSGGNGDWELRVLAYGDSDASYELSVDWELTAGGI